MKRSVGPGPFIHALHLFMKLGLHFWSESWQYYLQGHRYSQTWLVGLYRQLRWKEARKVGCILLTMKVKTSHCLESHVVKMYWIQLGIQYLIFFYFPYSPFKKVIVITCPQHHFYRYAGDRTSKEWENDLFVFNSNTYTWYNASLTSRRWWTSNLLAALHL